MHRCFKKIGNTAYIFSWESKAFSDKINNFPSAPNNILDPLLDYLGAKTRVKFDGSCLKQDKITNRGGTPLVVNVFGRNCIIFGVYMSPSVHAEKKKNIF